MKILERHCQTTAGTACGTAALSEVKTMTTAAATIGAIVCIAMQSWQ